MADVLEQIQDPIEPQVSGPGKGAVHPPSTPSIPSEAADRLARGNLRTQIAKLERELGELFGSAFPRDGIEWKVGAAGGPRVLGIGELERVRDALALRLRDAQHELARQADVEEANRGLLERMIAAPGKHRWLRISNEDIGERGCRHWHARPRWGILGMLAGWWRIRLSSGCPLAEGPRPPSQPTDLTPVANASKKKRRKRRARSKSNPATAGSDAVSSKTLSSAETKGSDASPRPKSRSARASKVDDDRPPAPWGSFPLVELVVLIGIVMLIVGAVIGFDEPRGQALLGTGLVLASLAGLELSVREHFGGYRSHTSLLTAAAGVASMLGLYYLVKTSAPAAMVGGAIVAALAAVLLVRAFRARSGGRMVKLR